MSAAKSLDLEIAQYLPRLNAKQKKTVLTVVKTFAEEQNDWWDEISAEQQEAIDRALDEVKAGKLTPHGEVMKTYAKWLKNKHTQLVYHYKPGKKQIEVLLFWGMKQKPLGFKY